VPALLPPLPIAAPPLPPDVPPLPPVVPPLPPDVPPLPVALAPPDPLPPEPPPPEPLLEHDHSAAGTSVRDSNRNKDRCMNKLLAESEETPGKK
jgi:hypothetical protein